MIEGGVAEFLKADSNISAHVVDRIYLRMLPQKVKLPAISFFVVSQVPLLSHLGKSNLHKTLFQFDIWSKSYSSGKDLANKVILRLDSVNQTKVIDGEAVSAVEIVEAGVDMFDPDVDENRVMLEARIWHTVT